MDRWEKTCLERKRKTERAARLQEMLEKAAPAVARKLGKWELLRQRQGARARTLEILVNRDNPAFISIRRKSDGTIHAFSHGRPQQDRKLLSAYNQEREEMYTWIRAELLAGVAKKTGGAQDIMDTVYETTNRLFSTRPALQKTVEKIAQEAVHGQGGWKDGMSFRTGLDSALRAAHAELGSVGKMLDPRTMETAKLVMSEGYTGPHPTPNVYNWVHLNRTVIRKLEKATPGILQYYVSRCWDPQAEPARLHPGEIIRAVREQTQLTRSEWRAFCRIGPAMFLQEAEFPPDEQQPSTLRLICRAAAEANQPQANANRLCRIAYMGYQCRFYHDAQWEAGDPWKAWVNLVSRYLNPGRPTIVPEHLVDTREYYNKEAGDIRRTEDALRNHVERQIPWGAGDWATLEARSERWHTEMHGQGERAPQQDPYGNPAEMSQQDQAAAWDSALGKFWEKDLTATPITTGPELHRLGEEMNNCLSSYTRRCQAGESRIFHITRNGQSTAAAEITRTGGPAGRRKKWKLNQMEAPRRGAIPADVHQLAGRLPDRYAAAETAS